MKHLKDVTSVQFLSVVQAVSSVIKQETQISKSSALYHPEII